MSFVQVDAGLKSSRRRRRTRRVLLFGICPASLAMLLFAQALLVTGNFGLALEHTNWRHILVAFGDVLLLLVVLFRMAKVVRDARRQGGFKLRDTFLAWLWRPLW